MPLDGAAHHMTFSPKNRVHALWVLLCWLWFSTAAPFAHQCQNAGEKRLPSWSSAQVTCIACEWATTPSSLQVSTPPAVESPVVYAQEWAAPVLLTPHTFFHLISARGPPVLA